MDEPVFREVNLSAEIRRIWGKEWNAPEIAYEFSNGRQFKLRTGDAAIYASSPEFE
jgi:hypothetical protein